jgi:hypothetical protein
VAAFNVTRQFGEKTKVLIDGQKGKFIVSSSSRWQSDNPDVIDIAQVINCQLDIRETKEEIKTKNNEGKSVSYNPPRYEFSYDFYVTIHVNSPYFNEIEVRLNNESAEYRGSAEYRRFEQQACDLQEALKPIQPAAQQE